MLSTVNALAPCKHARACETSAVPQLALTDTLFFCCFSSAVVMGAFKLRKMLDEAMKRYVPSWDHGRRDERKLSAFEVFADIG